MPESDAGRVGLCVNSLWNDEVGGDFFLMCLMTAGAVLRAG